MPSEHDAKLAEPVYYDGVNWQTFHAYFSGDSGGLYGPNSWHFLNNCVYMPDDNWVPANFTWTWDPNENEDKWRSAKWAMIYGNLELYDSEWEEPGPPSGVQQRTVTYTATDSDGATGTAKYVLSVHDPDEWYANDSGYDIDPKIFPDSGPQNTNVIPDPQNPTAQWVWQPPGGTIHTAIPKQLDQIDYGPNHDLIGGLLHTGGAVYPLILDAAGVEVGPYAIAVTGLLTITGFAAGAYDPKEPMWTNDISTTLGDFQQDISDQEKINESTAVANPYTDPNYVVAPKQPRFTDHTWADFLAGADSGLYYNGNGTDSNGIGGSFQVYACAVVTERATPYAAYQYDSGGLITDASGKPALTPAVINYVTGLKAVRTWTWVANTPPTH